MKVKKDRGYFHEEISKMLQFCDERTRVIVLLLASTGIRIGAIPTLKVGNIDNSNNKITVYENTKYEYLTFAHLNVNKRLILTLICVYVMVKKLMRNVF